MDKRLKGQGEVKLIYALVINKFSIKRAYELKGTLIISSISQFFFWLLGEIISKTLNLKELIYNLNKSLLLIFKFFFIFFG